MSDERVNHIAVGGVSRNEAAVAFHFLHQPHHLRIVNHERTFVGHECFERGNALGNHVLNFLLGVRVEIRYGHVEAVVAHGVAVGTPPSLLEG